MRWGFVAIVIGASLAGRLVTGELPDPEGDEAAKAEHRVLEGLVVGSDGGPVQGATIHFRPFAPDDRESSIKPAPAVTRTDREGRFSSADVTGLRFELGVHAEGHAFWTSRDHDPSQPLVVSLEQGRALSGQVLDEAGRGLAGVRVTLSDSQAFDLPGPEVATSREGGYRFPHVSIGTVWVQASAPGRATRTGRARVARGGGPAVADDLWLPEGGSVTGSVVDGAGSPVAGASVWVAPLDNVGGALGGRFPVVHARSDDDGAFSLDGVTAGTRYRVMAETVDEARGATLPFAMNPGALLEDVTIRLRQPATLRFRLLDAEERPAWRIAVRLDSEEESSREGLGRRQTIDRDSDKLVPGEDGWWTLRRLQPGVFEISIEPDGYLGLRRSGVVLRGGETTNIGKLTLEPGSSLRGRVVDRNEKPVGGAEVLARWRDLRGEYSRSAVSGDGGEFVVSGVPDHALTLEVIAEGFATSIVEEVPAGDEAVVVAVDTPGAIRGRVRLAEGGPPPSFSVRAVPKRRFRPAFGSPDESTTDKTDESFELRRLVPGTYSVEVRVPARPTARIERVRVRAGEVTDLGEVRFEQGLRLSGRVLRGDGDTPVAGVRIRADRGAGPDSWSRDPADATAISSRDGSFSVEGLDATRYTLTLVHPDLAPLQRSVVLDDGEPLDVVVFRLTAGGAVQGTVQDSDELPVAGAGIVVARAYGGYDVRTTSTGADGSFAVARLAPGHYIVVRTGPASRAGFGNQRTVEVREGEVIVLSFVPSARGKALAHPR